jgi:hypothetical protein
MKIAGDLPIRSSQEYPSRSVSVALMYLMAPSCMTHIPVRALSSICLSDSPSGTIGSAMSYVTGAVYKNPRKTAAFCPSGPLSRGVLTDVKCALGKIRFQDWKGNGSRLALLRRKKNKKKGVLLFRSLLRPPLSRWRRLARTSFRYHHPYMP